MTIMVLQANWGVKPHRDWVSTQYGGRKLLVGHSNIVFSSGSFDGWSSAGIATNVTERSLTALLIDGGAHHLDLMFSHPDDPVAVKEARHLELQMIQRWIEDFPKESGSAVSWGDQREL